METKVLLVYPPQQLMPTELPRFDGSLGPIYLAGALEREGIEVDVLDASVGTQDDHLDDTFNNQVMQENGLIRIGMTKDRLSEVIARGKYNVVGVHSNFTPQTRMALEVVKATKAVSTDILVLAGGVNARALPSRFLSSGADAVCATEGEKVVVEMVRSWESGKKPEVSGSFTMKDGVVVSHAVCPGDTITNLDDLPFPARHKLPFEHYDNTGAAGRDSLQKVERSASIMTSRGCPFRCAYCHISTEKEHGDQSGGIGQLRLKSVGRVMEELSELKRLGVTKIYIEDDSFLARKARVKEILTQVVGMGFHLAGVNGVNLVHLQKKEGGRLVIDEEYLDLFVSAGFNQIVFPVESASQRILDKYATAKLNHSTLDVVDLVRKAVKAGITCPINMMVGFPDETEEEIRSSVELGKRLVEAGADYCSLYVPIPFPGSQLFDMALREGYLEPNFDTDLFNWRKPTMKNTTVSPERIEELQAWGWRHANRDEYVKNRLARNIGKRWKSGEPEVV